MLPKLQPLTAIIVRYVAVHEFVLVSLKIKVMPYLISKIIYTRFCNEVSD